MLSGIWSLSGVHIGSTRQAVSARFPILVAWSGLCAAAGETTVKTITCPTAGSHMIVALRRAYTVWGSA